MQHIFLIHLLWYTQSFLSDSML